MFSIEYRQLTSHECCSTVVFKLGSGEKLLGARGATEKLKLKKKNTNHEVNIS